MDKLLCFLHEHTPSELGVAITVTFVGELRTSKHYSPYRDAYGRPAGGFGHLGMYPARLWCKQPGI